MFLIVGLGNPDKRYEHTRHNIGFDVIDAMADQYNRRFREGRDTAGGGRGGAGGGGLARNESHVGETADLYELKR